MLQCLEDEQLAEGAGECELCQGSDNRRVRADEGECGEELGRAALRGVDDGDIRKGQQGEERGEERAEDVDPKHHLLPGDLVTRKDLVLRRVRRAIQGEVDEEVYHANEAGVGRLVVSISVSVLRLFLAVAHAHENSDPGGDHEHDEVFVGRELAAVKEDIHDHNGDEFA